MNLTAQETELLQSLVNKLSGTVPVKEVKSSKKEQRVREKRKHEAMFRINILK